MLHPDLLALPICWYWMGNFFENTQPVLSTSWINANQRVKKSRLNRNVASWYDGN